MGNSASQEPAFVAAKNRDPDAPLSGGMVERVARAIFAADAEISRAYVILGSDRWEDHERRHPAYRAFARAALEAMREPSDAMIEAYCAKHSELGFTAWANASAVMPAMIDTALSEAG